MPDLSDEQMTQIKKFVETFPEAEREAKLEEILSQLVTDEKAPKTPQCPFCLLAEGKLKTQKVFEDEEFLAVLEINPANPGHTLLFPKKHLETIHALASLPEFLLIAENIAASVGAHSAGVNVLYSFGVVAGEKFNHFVVNIIPRKEKDDVSFTWKPKQSSEKELNEMREKIAVGLVKKKEEPVVVLDLDKIKKRMPSAKRRKV
ncbi:MAG: HIT family protein [Candidatus Nanoarchaeia archaeon]